MLKHNCSQFTSTEELQGNYFRPCEVDQPLSCDAQHFNMTVAAQENGNWPAICTICNKFLEDADLTAALLPNTIAAVKDLVQKKINQVETAKNCKPLKVKRATSADPAQHAEKKIKQEVKIEGTECKAEATEQKVEQLEERMCKAELISYHNLQVVEKIPDLVGEFGEKSEGTKKAITYPIFCKWCNKTFSGRNRAKIVQHTSGQEHRRRWRSKEAVGEVKAVDEDVKEEKAEDSADLLPLGKCLGLRLQSHIGRKTCLGSDLFPVWKAYTQYANLDKSLRTGRNVLGTFGNIMEACFDDDGV